MRLFHGIAKGLMSMAEGLWLSEACAKFGGDFGKIAPGGNRSFINVNIHEKTIMTGTDVLGNMISQIKVWKDGVVNNLLKLDYNKKGQLIRKTTAFSDGSSYSSRVEDLVNNEFTFKQIKKDLAQEGSPIMMNVHKFDNKSNISTVSRILPVSKLPQITIPQINATSRGTKI